MKTHDELAEAETIARRVASLNPWVVTLLAEYDRRGEWMTSAASTIVVTATQNGQLRKDLVRALPVVKAAGALHAVLGPDEDPEWSALGVELERFNHD